MVKYIFVTGGVVSSLGKGVASAAIGNLLENRGYKIALLKFDPYINIDAGTMSPYQHGEVYVTKDGAECDLDLGHYERFTNSDISADCNITTGKIYSSVIEKERLGKYIGQTVQIIPHITDEIKSCIIRLKEKTQAEIIICEIGGTVGDIESLPYLEAIRQFKKDVSQENVLYIHLSLIPYIHSSDEVKTKPTQHSVMKLREIGIKPDIILCRTELDITKELKEKIALYCDVEPDCVISARDVKFVYEVPIVFKEQRLDEIIIERLGLFKREVIPEKETEWLKMVDNFKNPEHNTNIAIVGKYTKLKDAYKSIKEALLHAGAYYRTKINICWVETEELKYYDNVVELFKNNNINGILIPGGFGYRGVDGKILAVRYARENNIAFLGICLGLQCAVIDIARNVICLSGANSTEVDPDTPYPVIDILEEHRPIKYLGASMRLGLYPTKLKNSSLVYDIYNYKKIIYERHRHRYEVNYKYRDKLESSGVVFSGVSLDNEELIEIVELKDHKWFIGVQFHPEFSSTPLSPHPIFKDFVNICKEK